MEVKDVVTIYQAQIDLQSIVDLDQELVQMIKQIQQTREQIKSDRAAVIESIHNVFDDLQNEVEKRRKRVIIETQKEYRKQFNDLDDIEWGMRAVQGRCKSIFPGKVPGPAFEYIKTLEKILDFQSDMISLNEDQVEKLRHNLKADQHGLGR